MYESLLKLSKDEKRALEQKIRHVIVLITFDSSAYVLAMLRSLSYVLETSNQGAGPASTRITDTEGSDFEFRIHQLQSRGSLLESSLNEQRKINLDLESDLTIALAEGIKYRDSLKKII